MLSMVVKLYADGAMFLLWSFFCGKIHNTGFKSMSEEVGYLCSCPGTAAGSRDLASLVPTQHVPLVLPQFSPKL